MYVDLMSKALFRKLESYISYVQLSAVLILLYWLISLLPLFTLPHDFFHHAGIGIDRRNHGFIVNPEYQKWVLVSIFVSVIFPPFPFIVLWTDF